MVDGDTAIRILKEVTKRIRELATDTPTAEMRATAATVRMGAGS